MRKNQIPGAVAEASSLLSVSRIWSVPFKSEAGAGGRASERASESEGTWVERECEWVRGGVVCVYVYTRVYWLTERDPMNDWGRSFTEPCDILVEIPRWLWFTFYWSSNDARARARELAFGHVPSENWLINKSIGLVSSSHASHDFNCASFLQLWWSFNYHRALWFFIIFERTFFLFHQRTKCVLCDCERDGENLIYWYH